MHARAHIRTRSLHSCLYLQSNAAEESLEAVHMELCVVTQQRDALQQDLPLVQQRLEVFSSFRVAVQLLFSLRPVCTCLLFCAQLRILFVCSPPCV